MNEMKYLLRDIIPLLLISLMIVPFSPFSYLVYAEDWQKEDGWLYRLEQGGCSIALPGGVDSSTPFLAFKTQIDGDLLAVKEPTDSQTAGSIIFLDISNPTNPEIFGKKAPWEGESIYTFYLDGKILLAVEGNPSTGKHNIFRIYDINDDVSNPSLLYEETFSEAEVIDAVFSLDGIAFLGFYDQIIILDTSTIESPMRMTTVNLSDFLSGRPCWSYTAQFLKQNEYLYYVSEMGRLAVLNIADINSPLLVADVAVNACAYDAQLVGNYAYVAAGLKGLFVYDFSDKSNPTLIAEYNFTCTMAIEKVSDNMLLLGDNMFGLYFIDVSNPQNLTIVTSIPASDRILDIAVKDGYAYTAEMAAGLSVVDLTTFEKINKIYLGNFHGVNPSVSFGASLQHEPGGSYSIGEPWVAVGFQTMVGKENNRIVDVPITTQISPIILYNDTNRDGKLTYEYERYANNSMLVRRLKIVDDVYFIGGFVNLPVIDIGDCTKTTKDGKLAFTFNYSVPNLEFNTNLEHIPGEFLPDNLIGNSGKADIVFQMWFIPKNKSANEVNATIKIDISIDLHDLDPLPPDGYSIFLGVNARINWDLISYPALSLIEGEDLPFYSLRIADQVAIFRLLNNFTVETPSGSYASNIIISNEYAWEDHIWSFEHVSRTILGMNFHNITSNATRIVYDPELQIFVNLPGTSFGTLPWVLVVPITGAGAMAVIAVLVLRRKRKSRLLTRIKRLIKPNLNEIRSIPVLF